MVDKKKSDKKKKVSLDRKLKMNPWILSTLVLGIIAIIFIIISFSGGTANISGQEAGQNVLDYLSSLGVGGEISEVNDMGSFYEIIVSVGETKGPVYLTKDGNFRIQPLGALTVGGETPSPQSPTNTNTQSVVKANTPSVELFVMTHCPYGTQAEKGLIPAIEYFGDEIDATIRFVHYFMHDPEETETPRQVCIREEQPDKWIDYLTCFLEDGDGARCDTEVGIDSAALATCISSGKADQYYSEDSSLSESYGVQGSPTLVVNGQIISSSRSPAGYLDTICQTFNDVPELCGGALDNTNPSPMWGWSASGSATSAQCWFFSVKIYKDVLFIWYMTKDKYLTEFESLVESNKNSSYKSGYKHEISLSSDKHNKEVNKDGSKEERTEIKKKLIYAESTARHPHSEKEEGASAAIADNALTYAVRIGDPGLAYSSALVYEKLKRGSSPSTKRRLLKSIKNSRVKVNVGTLEKIEEFLKRNPSEEGGLVDKVSEKVAVFIFE